MGLRFRKSFKIAPGVKVNLNKKSAGVTIGTKGAHYTVNTSGKRTASVGIPGTGLSYSTSSGGGKKGASRKASKKDTFNRVIAVVIAIVAVVCTVGAVKTALDKKTSSQTAPAAALSQLIGAGSSNTGGASAADTVSPDVSASPAADSGLPDASAANDTAPVSASSTADTLSGTADAVSAVPESVWISSSGKKYHARSDCSGMENAEEITLQEALDMGKEPCKRCYPE